MKLPTMSAGLRPPMQNYSWEIGSSLNAEEFEICPQQNLSLAMPTNQTNLPPSMIYARGLIKAEFPSLSVEKEFYQATANMTDLGLTPTNELLYQVLGKTENLYIAREMCYLLSINGINVYVLAPATESELGGLITGLAPHSSFDFDIVEGFQTGMSNPERCNGVELPLFTCTNVSTFTSNEMVQSVVAQTHIPEENAATIITHYLTLTDNMGQNNADRAINFLTLRYLDIYRLAYDMETMTKTPDTSSGPADPEGFSLTNVSAQPAKIQGGRTIYEVIFSFSGNSTSVYQQWACQVDLTGLHPFLVNPLVRYYSKP